jgi:ankyrin repeat protein
MLGQQLLAAAAQGDVVAVRNLLAGNAPVDVQDARGNTPLLLATAANHIEVARSLLMHGASPISRTRCRTAPICWPARRAGWRLCA